MREKIIDIDDFKEIRQALKEKNKTIVHCHGVFDLLHPGHIIYFEEAKKLGDILIVSITSDDFVNKGPDRPYFNDELRLLSLAALEFIDYVMLSKDYRSLSLIEIIRPDIYVKGQEYNNSEEINKSDEFKLVTSLGGKVHFTSGIKFSSTKILNTAFSAVPEKLIPNIMRIKQKYSVEDIANHFKKLEDVKILVVGEIIIDQYIFCDIKGTMTKGRAYSSSFLSQENYLGGSLAIANHLSSFSKNVTLCSMSGDEQNINQNIKNELGKKINLNLVHPNGFKTIMKKKFIQKVGKRDEYEKMFAVNHVQTNQELSQLDRREYYEKVKYLAASSDMVIVCDYGHGLVDNILMDIIEKESKFICVNCQTNSTNYGTNLITKYKRADVYTLDMVELKLAFASDKEPYNNLLPILSRKFGSKYGWLTRGSDGAVGIKFDNELFNCPPLTLVVLDTVGAGDGFFALSCLGAYLKLDLELATILGNIGGAFVANSLNNSQPLEKERVLQYINTIMNI